MFPNNQAQVWEKCSTAKSVKALEQAVLAGFGEAFFYGCANNFCFLYKNMSDNSFETVIIPSFSFSFSKKSQVKKQMIDLSLIFFKNILLHWIIIKNWQKKSDKIFLMASLFVHSSTWNDKSVILTWSLWDNEIQLIRRNICSMNIFTIYAQTNIERVCDVCIWYVFDMICV